MADREKGLTWRILAKTLAMLVFVLIGLSPVTAKEFAPEGGSGGGFFRDPCPTGQYLVGTNAHTGLVVDQISITCAFVNPDGSTGAQFHGPNRGGPGGSTPAPPPSPRLTTCGDHEIITAMGLLPGDDAGGSTVIRLIIFNCVSTTGTARHNLEIGDVPFFPNTQQICPDGEAATGIQGRSGTFVDALGLICGPFTRPSSGTSPSAGGCSGLAGEELDICNEHNVERAKHGVPLLNWSADLAKNAQDWVKGCHTSKNSNGDEFFCHQSKVFGCGTDSSYHYGENLRFGYPTLSGKQAVDLWYCEINVYDFDHPAVGVGTTFGCDNNPDKVTGHFTQVVWRESSNLGCAQNTCSLGGNSGTLWACEYDPPGNFNVDQPGVLNLNVPKPLLDLNVPRPLQGFALPQRTTAIISDVDLYDIPGGVGRVIGILRQGQKFPLVGCRADDWCQISEGWVWGSFIMRNHSR